MSFIPWTRLSEQFLIEALRETRCLWDYDHPNYMKKGYKRQKYHEIARRLGENFPELADLHGDQVRSRINSLKSYFSQEHKRIQVAPTGSADKPSSKWELFDLMSFLIDAEAPKPTNSSGIDNQIVQWTAQSVQFLVKDLRKRQCLWDPKHSRFRQNALQRKHYEEITMRLKDNFPELYDLDSDQVRKKFYNLKNQFHCEYVKMKAAPRGSAGKSSSKWELFDLMSFLKDTVAPQPTDSSDKNQWNNWTLLSEQFLLEDVRERRCMWDPEHPDFLKKKLKRKNYEEITKRLQENFPELANLHYEQVRNKFNNLKSYFSREYKKSIAAPSGEAAQSNSKWELFESMSFLKDTEAPLPTNSNDIDNKWTTLSELFLVEDVRESRCLWDYNHDNFMKKGLAKKSYEEITKRLKENFPELVDIQTSQVRRKFNDLKAYFFHEYKRIQAAPSGLSGKPSSEWELFDLMSFLKDTSAPQPTNSSDIEEPQLTDSSDIEEPQFANSSDIDNKVNPIDAALLVEVDHNTLEEISFDDSLGEGSDQCVMTTTPTSSSSVQNHKANNSSKKRKLQNSSEGASLQTLKKLDRSGNANTPDDLSSTFAKTVEHWLRSLSPRGQKVASFKITQVLMDVEEKYGLDS